MNLDFAIGLHIVGFLASRQGEPLTSETMAETFGTSPVVLRRVLSRLNQAGLVETKRGVGGGSVLARGAERITLRAVYQAVCVRHEIFKRHPEGNGPVASVLGAYINELYASAEASMLAQLDSTSVADMDAIVRPKICSAMRRL